MGRRQLDEAVQHARFKVSELTNSRIRTADDQRRAAEVRAQRLREVGWDARADEIETEITQRWGDQR